MMLNIGIDVHKRRCYATVKGEFRGILMQERFDRTYAGIRRFIDSVRSQYPNQQMRAVVESTANYWMKVHDSFEDAGIDTLVAHPIKTKAIAEARLKNDKIDSATLADLLRADLVYESYVPDKEHREFRQLVRARMDLVAMRTMNKNKIHAILAKYEFKDPECSVFSDRGTQWLRDEMMQQHALSWVDKMQLESLLDFTSSLDKHIDTFTAKVASLAKEDPRVRLLMTMPGVDYLTALTVMSEIVDVRRFPTPWKLVAYAGLAPSQRDTGDTVRRGRITKQGSKWLRYAMCEAANTAIRRDERLREFYQRIEARRGLQKARIATAKEMLVIVWHMLTNNEPYRGTNSEAVQRKYKRMGWKANSA